MSIHTTLTRLEAIRVIKQNSCDYRDFLADHGEHCFYSGASVYGWLGLI